MDQEWTYRQDRRLARLLNEAKLRLPTCPEDIDYQYPRGLDRGMIRSLANCQWYGKLGDAFGQFIMLHLQ